MIRSRVLATALLLATGMAACSSDDVTDPANGGEYDDELAAVLAAAEATVSADSRDRRPRHPLFDELAAEIPGFGGFYRAARCVVVVVLTEEGDAQHAVRVASAALEPIARGACPDGLTVQTAPGKFTYNQLQRILAAAQDLLNIRGVVGMKLDFKANKVVILVASRDTVDRVLAALPRVGVPEEAVAFRPGRIDGTRDRAGSRG
ncbi:MAG TPA: hypothetical protein VF192_10845 [Longimicrobiales bacterium]